MESRKYWPEPNGGCVTLEVRSTIALHLIEQNTSTVAGKLDTVEDSTGRARVTLQEPKELVSRAFAIADAFIDAAESRGEIRSAPTQDEIIAQTEERFMRRRAERDAAAVLKEMRDEVAHTPTKKE